MWEWLSELEVEEEVVQAGFQDVGVVFAQLSQVEVGVSSLARRLRASSEVDSTTTSETKRPPTFHHDIKALRESFGTRFVKELKALDDVRHVRNHFAHGEMRVGVASIGAGAGLEPVIALVFSEKGLPEGIHEADPLRDVVEGDLDIRRAMEIASEGLEALMTIMLETGFSPYAEDTEQ